MLRRTFKSILRISGLPHRTPRVMSSLANAFGQKSIWHAKPYDDKGNPVAYLTFDDGPTPLATPFVLDQLRLYNAKATFFCLGKEIAANGDIVERIVLEGHRVGNHSYWHPDGTKVSTDNYMADVTAAHELMLPLLGPKESWLFRPPYGLMSHAQGRLIRNMGYQVVRWEVVVGDWDRQANAQQLAKDTLAKLKPGSIVVLHDSVKAYPIMKQVLPELLQGWRGQWHRL